jgi:hypothetical protein
MSTTQTNKDFVTHEEFEEYKKELEKKIGKKEKKTRPPSDYNIFMKTEVSRLRSENPSLKNTEAFKLSTQNWAKHKASLTKN